MSDFGGNIFAKIYAIDGVNPNPHDLHFKAHYQCDNIDMVFNTLFNNNDSRILYTHQYLFFGMFYRNFSHCSKYFHESSKRFEWLDKKNKGPFYLNEKIKVYELTYYSQWLLYMFNRSNKSTPYYYASWDIIKKLLDIH